MLKKIIQLIGLSSFILFSFFYTDKVMEVVREEDHIMIELKNIQDVVNVEAKDAIISGNTIVPGMRGRRVNIDKSYKNMKSLGVFQQKDIIYDDIVPDVSMDSYYDKYVVMGSPYKQMVSIVFILDQDKYLNDLEKIIDYKDIIVNYFVSYDYLINHSIKIKELNSMEFYSYGDDGVYTSEHLLFSNNLINRISNNQARFCFSIVKKKSTLDICKKNRLHTIIPSIVGSSKPYEGVKSHLNNGSIIYLDFNQNSIQELSLIVDYIRGKGFEIVGLSQLVSEEFS